MLRALIGAVAGAVVMFILGFIFFATPLQKIAIGNLDDMQAAAVQRALASNLPQTGTYYVPDGDTPAQSTMYGQGPVATIHYNSHGFAVSDTSAMVGGFVHMLVVTLLMAFGLHRLSRHVTLFSEQVVLLAVGVVGAAIYMRLGEPVWYHHDWTYAIYAFVADAVSLGAAGLIILKLLPPWRTKAAPSEAAAAAVAVDEAA